MDVVMRRYVAWLLRCLPPRLRVLEYGSRDINGSVRDLFTAAERYVGVDLRPGPGVDVVADALFYAPDFEPDTVVCLSVLEHAVFPESLIAKAWKLLGKGGVLVVGQPSPEWPAHSGIDGGRLRPEEHYRSPTGEELIEWLQPFRAVRLWRSSRQFLGCAMK